MSECDISQCSSPSADKLSNGICDADDPLLNSIECCWDGFDCPIPTAAPTVSVGAPSTCVVSASCIEKITKDPNKEIDWLGDGFCDDWIGGFNTFVSLKPSISQEPSRNYEIEEPRPKSFLVVQYFLGAFTSLILVLGVGGVIRYYRKKHGIADERPNRHRHRPPSRVQGSSPSRVNRTSSNQPDTYNDNETQYESNVSRWFNTPQVTDFMTSEHFNRQIHSTKTCAICCEDFMPFDLVARIKSDQCCGTIFHHHCLSTWLNSNHDECPTCRCSMFNVDLDSL